MLVGMTNEYLQFSLRTMLLIDSISEND